MKKIIWLFGVCCFTIGMAVGCIQEASHSGGNIQKRDEVKEEKIISMFGGEINLQRENDDSNVEHPGTFFMITDNKTMKKYIMFYDGNNSYMIYLNRETGMSK